MPTYLWISEHLPKLSQIFPGGGMAVGGDAPLQPLPTTRHRDAGTPFASLPVAKQNRLSQTTAEQGLLPSALLGGATSTSGGELLGHRVPAEGWK